MSGSGATMECDAGGDTGIIGIGGASIAAATPLSVVAVHEPQPQSTPSVAACGAALTDGASVATPCEDAAGARPDCIDAISLSDAQRMPAPSDPARIGS